jgi:hypothetical protein
MLNVGEIHFPSLFPSGRIYLLALLGEFPLPKPAIPSLQLVHRELLLAHVECEEESEVLGAN